MNSPVNGLVATNGRTTEFKVGYNGMEILMRREPCKVFLATTFTDGRTGRHSCRSGRPQVHPERTRPAVIQGPGRQLAGLAVWRFGLGLSLVQSFFCQYKKSESCEESK